MAGNEEGVGMISSCRQMDEHPPLLRSTPFKGGLSWVESCSRGCVSKANVAYEYCGDGDLNNQAGVALESLDGAFTGKPWDPDAQLYYFPYRYYSPKNARWLTRDPLGMVDGPNVYAYVRGNPVNLIDPLGQAIGTILKRLILLPFEAVLIYCEEFSSDECISAGCKAIRTCLHFVVGIVTTVGGNAACFIGCAIVPPPGMVFCILGCIASTIIDSWITAKDGIDCMRDLDDMMCKCS